MDDIIPIQAEAHPPPTNRNEPRLLAPVWHTIAMVVLMLANSYVTARIMARTGGRFSAGSRMTQYGFTIVLELFLLLLVWIGLRLRNFKLRDLIGGGWKTPESFLIDVSIAAGFWIVSAAVLAGLGYVMGMANPSQVNEVRQRLGGIVPQTRVELGVWILLCITAGFVEEVLFRGYLQRQIGALFGNTYTGVALSALIFGAVHGYEGIKNMVRIAVFGALFGVLVLWRKSLRPGMMAHAWQDALAGILLHMINQRNGSWTV